MGEALRIWLQVLDDFESYPKKDTPACEVDVCYHLFVVLAHCLAFGETCDLDKTDTRFARVMSRRYRSIKAENPLFATPAWRSEYGAPALPT
eukprot:2441117-Rhodomonas_salina.1